MKPSIFSLTRQEFIDFTYASLGKGKEHAGILYGEWYRLGQVSDGNPAFKTAQHLYRRIVDLFDWSELAVDTKSVDAATHKFLLKTHDDLPIECVAIPMQAGWTLCVSSQVGCKMGCTFCETAKMGLVRSLQTEEIVAQLFFAKFTKKFPIKNIVFMGMGEPLDNYDAVKQAIAVFCDLGGLGFGSRQVTVSTCGRVDGIKRLIEDKVHIHLAVSLNAPNNMIRNQLMPVNRRADLSLLYESMKEYGQVMKRSILVEYVLIDGITDSEEDARQVADYLRGLNVKVNLIPYNPQRTGVRFKSPQMESVDSFAAVLRKEGYRTLIRLPKGQQAHAACGQLGHRKWRQKKRELCQQ